MIYKQSILTINGNNAKLDEDIYLFRLDKNIELYFTIVNNKYKFNKSDLNNIINLTNASYFQMRLYKNAEVKYTFAIQPTDNGKAILTITDDLIDEPIEVGDYDFQISLLDADKSSMISLPIVSKQIHVCEPLVTDASETGTAVLGLSTLESGEIVDAFDEEGNYIRKVHVNGELISAELFNKWEEALETNSSNIKTLDSQFKDIANVLNNIQTDVEVTKDIKISISDNTFIPATAQEQEVTVEFTKGNTNAIPVFTNLFKGKTSVQINNITSQLLNEDEIEYKGTGNDSGTTAYFRAGVGNLIYNHVYYYSIWLKSSDNTINYTLGIDSNVRGTVTETYKKYSCLETNRVSVANATAYMGVKAGIFKPNATYFMKKPMCIDLTALYGEGNEPTLEEFDNLIGDNWCLGTYTPPSGTVSNDFTIKSYKSDNSLIDSLDSKTDTTIKIIGGGYVNITADILPKSAILKNVKYTEKRKLEIEEKGLNIGSYENALTLINSNKDNIFMYILIQGEIQKPIWHIGNGVFIDAVGAIISL